jgi:hypothetical protein
MIKGTTNFELCSNYSKSAVDAWLCITRTQNLSLQYFFFGANVTLNESRRFEKSDGEPDPAQNHPGSATQIQKQATLA